MPSAAAIFLLLPLLLLSLLFFDDHISVTAAIGDGQQKPDHRCASTRAPGHESCTGGLCFDLLNLETESIQSGCAKSSGVSCASGCSLQEDAQIFICCCAQPFCNGKSPHLVKARWNLFQRGDYPGNVLPSTGNKKFIRDISRETQLSGSMEEKARNGTTNAKGEEKEMAAKAGEMEVAKSREELITTTRKSIINQKQKLTTEKSTMANGRKMNGEEEKITETTGSRAEVKEEGNGTETGASEGKGTTMKKTTTTSPTTTKKTTTITTTTKTVTTNKRKNEGTITKAKAQAGEEQSMGSVSTNGTTIANGNIEKRKPTWTKPKAVKKEEKKKEKMKEKEEMRKGQKEEREEGIKEGSSRGTTAKGTIIAQTATNGVSRSKSDPMPIATTTSTTRMPLPSNTTAKRDTTTETTTSGPIVPAGGSQEEKTKGIQLWENNTPSSLQSARVTDGQSTTGRSTPVEPTSRASSATTATTSPNRVVPFQKILAVQTHNQEEEKEEGSGSSARTTRSATVPTTRPPKVGYAIAQFPWYWVAMAGFLCSSLAFLAVYWSVKGCRRIFAKRTAGRRSSAARESGEEMTLAKTKGGKRGERPRSAKEYGNGKGPVAARERAKVNGQISMSTKTTNESLSQCTTTSTAIVEQRGEEEHLELGESVTVTDPLLNKQWNGTMSK